MKILMSLGIFYPSQVGGPGNTLYWMGKELVKQGISVTAVVSDRGVSDDFAPRDQWVDLDGIKIKYIVSGYITLFFRLVWHTLKEIPKNDVVMLSSFFYKPNFFVGLAALIGKKRVIWSPRGELLIPRGITKRSYLRLLRFFFVKRVLFHATSAEEALAISQFMGADARCAIIPNYMELPEKVNPKSEEKYLLYVGRIVPVKALENLIRGVAMSNRFSQMGYKLYFAGKNEGAYYDRLLEMISELGLSQSIFFKGLVEGEEKESLFAGAKATLLVSHSENFGNVVIESLAQGTPVIASKGTPWQALPENNAGYWIDNSPEEIGQAIDTLFSLSENHYQEMREQAYQFCTEQFDVKKNIDKWLEVINKKDVYE